MKEVKNEGGKEEGRPEEDCSVRFKVSWLSFSNKHFASGLT